MEENILEAEAAAKLPGNSLVVWARGAISSFKETVTSFRVFCEDRKEKSSRLCYLISLERQMESVIRCRTRVRSELETLTHNSRTFVIEICPGSI